MLPTSNKYASVCSMPDRSAIIKPIEDRVRQVATERGGLAQLARDTEISKATLSRFLSGERLPSAEALEILAQHFELQLRPTTPRRRGQ